jgi:hypothetical protein
MGARVRDKVDAEGLWASEGWKRERIMSQVHRESCHLELACSFHQFRPIPLSERILQDQTRRRMLGTQLHQSKLQFLSRRLVSVLRAAQLDKIDRQHTGHTQWLWRGAGAFKLLGTFEMVAECCD